MNSQFSLFVWFFFSVFFLQLVSHLIVEVPRLLSLQRSFETFIVFAQFLKFLKFFSFEVGRPHCFLVFGFFEGGGGTYKDCGVLYGMGKIVDSVINTTVIT